MVKWEYKKAPISSSEINNLLDFFGERGWELISVNKEDDWYYCIFKRPKEDDEKYEYCNDLAEKIQELRETIDNYNSAMGTAQEES